MWAKFGCRTEESKKVAGYFSGSPDSQWGTSSASYAQSIKMLKSTAWEQIEDGALEFAKFGRRFKTASSGIKDVHVYIMDCDSDDDSVSSSISGHNKNDSQECAASQVERNWEQWNCDEDVPSPCSALAASQILDFHTTSPQPTPRLQPLVSADAAAIQIPNYYWCHGYLSTVTTSCFGLFTGEHLTLCPWDCYFTASSDC